MRVLSPASPLSADILRLFDGVLILSCAIFALVGFLVFWSVFRYRARTGRSEPAGQSHGHRALEITWTLVPLLIVATLFVFTVRVMHSTEPDSVPPAPEIQITGKQWWWQAKYSNGIYTANEIHVPSGRRIAVWILGGDVIHDFWVPELGPKIDAVPGRTNAIWIEADRPGLYRGWCAEYCGTEHAWMLIRVIAQPPAEYAAWLDAQSQPAPVPAGGDAQRGAKLFRDRTCVNCHAIAGTNATARVGPDLSHIASRETLGAGVIQNTPENLARWVRNPQQIKPGILMPNLKLTEEEVRQMTAYLETLK